MCVCNDIEIKERLKLETRLLNQIRWVSKVRDSYTKTKINKYYEPDMNCDCEIQRKNSTGFFSLLADGIMDKKRVYIHLIRRSLSKETAVEKKKKKKKRALTVEKECNSGILTSKRVDTGRNQSVFIKSARANTHSNKIGIPNVVSAQLLVSSLSSSKL